MIPLNKHMVLNMEHIVPATTSPLSLSTLSGFTDYTAVVASNPLLVILSPFILSPHLLVPSSLLSDIPAPSYFQDAYVI